MAFAAKEDMDMLMQSHQDIRERLDDKDITEKLLEENVEELTARNIRMSEAVDRNEGIMETDRGAFMKDFAEVSGSAIKSFNEIRKDIEDNKNQNNLIKDEVQLNKTEMRNNLE